MTMDEDKIARLFGAFGDIFDDQASALSLASRIAGGDKGVRESPDGLKLTLEDCHARASRDGMRLAMISREIESVLATGEVSDAAGYSEARMRAKSA